MQRQRRREVSLDEKLRYLREIESIHRLSKKVLPPQGTTWAKIARPAMTPITLSLA